MIGNPIPAEHALDPGLVTRAIEDGLADAEALEIRGKALTPHLLAFLSRATGKRSLAANRALALHNAQRAAEIAVALGALS